MTTGVPISTISKLSSPISLTKAIAPAVSTKSIASCNFICTSPILLCIVVPDTSFGRS